MLELIEHLSPQYHIWSRVTSTQWPRPLDLGWPLYSDPAPWSRVTSMQWPRPLIKGDLYTVTPPPWPRVTSIQWSRPLIKGDLYAVTPPPPRPNVGRVARREGKNVTRKDRNLFLNRGQIYRYHTKISDQNAKSITNVGFNTPFYAVLKTDIFSNELC